MYSTIVQPNERFHHLENHRLYSGNHYWYKFLQVFFPPLNIPSRRSLLSCEGLQVLKESFLSQNSKTCQVEEFLFTLWGLLRTAPPDWHNYLLLLEPLKESKWSTAPLQLESKTGIWCSKFPPNISRVNPKEIVMTSTVCTNCLVFFFVPMEW